MKLLISSMTIIIQVKEGDDWKIREITDDEITDDGTIFLKFDRECLVGDKIRMYRSSSEQFYPFMESVVVTGTRKVFAGDTIEYTLANDLKVLRS